MHYYFICGLIDPWLRGAPSKRPTFSEGRDIMTKQETTTQPTISPAQKTIITAIRSSVKNGNTIASGFNTFIKADDSESVQGIITVFFNEKETHRIKNDLSNKALKDRITNRLTKAGDLTGKSLKEAISKEYNATKSKAECKNWDAARKAVTRAYAQVDLKANIKDGILSTGPIPAPQQIDSVQGNGGGDESSNVSDSGNMDTAQTFDKITALIHDLSEVGAKAELKALQAFLADTVNAMDKQSKAA